MAVAEVGTPTAISLISTTNTTVSATNTWSASQPRTAGDLLVMIVNAGAATSVTLPTTPSGWTQALAVGNTTTAHAAVAVFWAIAAGGDAAPVSSVTTAGSSSQVGCLLMEFSGIDSSVPVGTSGTYASGSSGQTLTGITVTTSGSVPGTGGYGIAVFATERSSGQAITWTPGAGWTNLENDGSNTARIHQAIDYYAGPPSGATLSDAATFTSISGAFGAAGIVVIQAPAATVTAGAAQSPALTQAAGATASGASRAAGAAQAIGVTQAAGASGPQKLIAQWTGTQAIGDGTGTPLPPTMPLEVPVSNTGDSGNGLIALVSWTLPPGYLGADMAVTDDAHNTWWPLGAPGASSSSAGYNRSAIWACPGASAASNVYVSPCGLPNPCYPGVIGVTIVEIAGFPQYAGGASVYTKHASSATSISVTAAAPSSSALVVAVAASDGYDSGEEQPVLSGSGWSTLDGVKDSGGGTTGGVPLVALGTSAAWQITSGSVSPSWTITTAGDLSAVVAVIELSAGPPAAPGANWPGFQLLAGFGAGALTPPGQITWTDITARWLAGQDTTATTGKQYELSQLQAAEDNITLDDNDGALTPDNPDSIYYPNVTADLPLRLVAWWDKRTYGVLAGYAEQIPISWDASWYGLAKTVVTDVWSLQQNQLNSVLQEETTWDPNLYAYWPCSDAQYATGTVPNLNAVNAAPGNTNELQVLTSKNGALGAAQQFGAQGSGLPGDQSGTFWEQKGLAANDEGYGYCLYCADPGYPSLTGGVTFAGWFYPSGGTTQVDNNANQLIILRASNAGTGAVVQVQFASPVASQPGAIQVAVWTAAGVKTVTTVYPANWLEAGWIHIALTVNQAAWTLWVNGANAGNGTCDLVSSFSWVQYMGSADRFYTGSMLNGACGELSIFGVQLPPDRIRSLYLAGTPNPQTVAGGATQSFTGNQFAGEYAAQRIERLLAYGGWTGPRSISQSSVTAMEAITDIQGSTAVISASGGVNLSAGGMMASEAASSIVFSDGGFIFTDGNGTLCYFSRADLYQLANSWTLGEDTAAGEIPYLDTAQLGYDKSLLHNGAELTPAASVSGAPIVASNPSSIAAHGEYVYNGMAYQQDSTVIADEAYWIVNTRGVVTLRAKSLTVDAMANASVWPFVLGVQPSQAVTVYRRPQLATYTVTFNPITVQVTKTIDYQSGHATAKIATDRWPEGQVLIIGDSTRGQLTGDWLLGW